MNCIPFLYRYIFRIREPLLWVVGIFLFMLCLTGCVVKAPPPGAHKAQAKMMDATGSSAIIRKGFQTTKTRKEYQ